MCKINSCSYCGKYIRTKYFFLLNWTFRQQAKGERKRERDLYYSRTTLWYSFGKRAMEVCRVCSLTMALVLEAVLLLLAKTCEGAFECLCTTQECQSRDDIICRTNSMCYVQYMPSPRDHAPQDTPPLGALPPLLVHGCIDTRTALLCENQKPKFYSGSWPVMHCCSGELCNKDVVPTLPPWGTNLQGSTNDSGDSKNLKQFPETDPEEAGEGVTETDEDSRTDDASQWQISVNPLYVGVPVAGACVLLAIIVFAIYILRRQNQMYEEQYLRTYAKSRPPYIYQDGCRYVAMVTKSGQPFLARCHNGCLYAESEGSSNGSESRLLAHV